MNLIPNFQPSNTSKSGKLSRETTCKAKINSAVFLKFTRTKNSRESRTKYQEKYSQEI